MDLTFDEEKLVTSFRRLTSEGKAEAVEYLSFLATKHRRQSSEGEETQNQCRLNTTEDRPEKAKEPIFTE
jgi:hypothetical protein